MTIDEDLMKRREFLRHTATTCVGLAFSKVVPLSADAATSTGWRTFEVTTRVEVLKPSGITHIWLPAALIGDTPFQKTLANRFTAQGGTAKFSRTKRESLGVISASYPEHATPVLTLTSRVSLKNYGVDLSAPNHAARVSRAELEYYL